MTHHLVIAKPCKRLWQSVPFVIAVRVSGGHLCEAEAPTEPAGETAARCAAISFPRPPVIAREQCDRGNPFSPKGYLRILSRYAPRMTDHLVIAKPCERLWQSVPFSFTTMKNTDPSNSD